MAPVLSRTQDLSEEVAVDSGSSSGSLSLIAMELIRTYRGTPWPSLPIPGQAATSRWRSRGETTLAATDPNQTAMCPPSNLAGRVKPISIRCSISDRRVDSKRLIGVRVVPPDEGATSGAESRQSTERQQRRADDRRLGVRRRVQQEFHLVSSEQIEVTRPQEKFHEVLGPNDGCQTRREFC
jgi:hypothetical protein